MKNSAKKLWVKLLCGFLLVLFAVTGTLSAILVGTAGSYGAYNENADINDYTDSLFKETIYDDLCTIADDYYPLYIDAQKSTLKSDPALDYYIERFSAENSNLGFTITASDGTELMKSYDVSNYRAKDSATFEADTGVYRQITVTGSVRNDLTANDKYKSISDFVQETFTHRYTFIVTLAASVVMFIALFCFLMYAAGRRENSDEICARWIDRIPCDLFTVILLTIGSCFTAAAGDIPSDINYVTIIGLCFAAFAVVESLLLIMLCMSWAVRFKIGKWWRNSIIYMVLHWFFTKPGKRIAELFRSLPVIWKAAVYALLVFILELIALQGDGLLWFIINVAVGLVTVFSALWMSKLKKAAKSLADGNLDYRVDTSGMRWGFKAHGEDLNRIGDGIAVAVEKQLKSERMKTELITNVSHDIKTPLTSIINYVDLLEKEDIQPDKAKEYLEVLSRQTARLRKLTEDVIEASKASTGNIPVNLEQTDMNVLLSQAVGEYGDKLEEKNLEVVMELISEPINIMADGNLLWRVFDNLMGNITKYALSGTRVYIATSLSDDTASVTFRNISEAPLNISSSELMERFVRGDASRNTPGSGLGLSIAESLVKLQNGVFGIDIDGDLFKATVSFKSC